MMLLVPVPPLSCVAAFPMLNTKKHIYPLRNKAGCAFFCLFVRFLSSFSSTFYGVRLRVCVKRYKRNRLNQPIVRSLCAYRRRMLDWGREAYQFIFMGFFFLRSFVIFTIISGIKERTEYVEKFPAEFEPMNQSITRFSTVKCVTQFEMKRCNRDKSRDVFLCTDDVGDGSASIRSAH